MPLVGGIYDDFINACPYVTKVGTGDGGRVDAEKLCREACRNPPLRAAMVAHYTARLKRRKEEGFQKVLVAYPASLPYVDLPPSTPPPSHHPSRGRGRTGAHLATASLATASLTTAPLATAALAAAALAAAARNAAALAAAAAACGALATAAQGPLPKC